MKREWLGRRWWEFHVGYTTYLTFICNFSNFILILYSLTVWFGDIPLHVLGIVMFCMIVPVATLIDRKHNRIQLRTEQGQMQHLHPYNDEMVPESEEGLQTKFNVMMLNYIPYQRSQACRGLASMRAAFERVYNGEYATEAMKNEKI